MGEMEFMDLLFSRYASPMDFMKMYIDQGRFGEFVSGIIEMDDKRKQEEEEKENDSKLWLAYLMSMSNKSFAKWKEELANNTVPEPESYAMTDEQVEAAKQTAKGIMKKISPV